jgi:hypothetical protein
MKPEHPPKQPEDWLMSEHRANCSMSEVKFREEFAAMAPPSSSLHGKSGANLRLCVALPLPTYSESLTTIAIQDRSLASAGRIDQPSIWVVRRLLGRD